MIVCGAGLRPASGAERSVKLQPSVTYTPGAGIRTAARSAGLSPCSTRCSTCRIPRPSSPCSCTTDARISERLPLRTSWRESMPGHTDRQARSVVRRAAFQGRQVFQARRLLDQKRTFSPALHGDDDLRRCWPMIGDFRPSRPESKRDVGSVSRTALLRTDAIIYSTGFELRSEPAR